MRTNNRRRAHYIILGIAAALASVACESSDPTGAGITPSVPARTGLGFGSGNVVESDSSTATADGTENTTAADSGSTATTSRGGVTFGSGN